jgi:hypothetical protein
MSGTSISGVTLTDGPDHTFDFSGKPGADATGLPAQAGTGGVGDQGDKGEVTPTDTYGNVKCSVQPSNGKQGKDGLTGSLGFQPGNGDPSPSQIYNLGLVTGQILVKAGGGNGGKGGKGGLGGQGGPGGPAGSQPAQCNAANQGPGGRGGQGGDGHVGGTGGDTGNIVINFYTGSSGDVQKYVLQGKGGDGGDPGDPGPPGPGGPGSNPGNLGPGHPGVRGKDGSIGTVTINYVAPPSA